MKPTRRVIGIGETVLDVIFRHDQPQQAVPGGSTFNAMISLGRTLGVRRPDIELLMVTETGDDHIGDLVVRFLTDNHISTEAVTRNAGTQTHISMAFLDDHNDAHYEFYKDHKHASLNPARLAGITFRPGDVVVFGSFFAINPVLRDFTRRLLTEARQAGALLYYDINFRPSHLADLPVAGQNIVENCRLSHFVRGSIDDFACLYGTHDAAEVYERHIAPLCPNFICTHGGDPIRVFWPGGTLDMPVPRVRTVSTIGAGDNFNAGFVYGLMQSNILPEADGQVAMTPALWRRQLATARKFSAAACRTVFNYVNPDFVKRLP